MNEAIAQRGLRLIAPDRPGVGQSDFQPNRGFSNWVDDMVFLTDSLSLNKLSVLGSSGGYGYVAACAAKIPERLHAAVIVSGAWRIDLNTDLPMMRRFVWMLIKYFPVLYQIIIQSMEQSLKSSPEKLLATFKQQFSPKDYAALAQPGRLQPFCDTTFEAMRGSAKGVTHDLYLNTQEWDFSLDAIRMPLMVFHGEQDRNVPIASVKRFLANLPTVKFISYPEEGHFSLIINQLATIAKVLVGE